MFRKRQSGDDMIAGLRIWFIFIFLWFLHGAVMIIPPVLATCSYRMVRTGELSLRIKTYSKK